MTRSDGLLISVVIPTYNYADMLPRALSSVLEQLSDDSELIVVDDGSTDSTPVVLADYQSRHPTLRVISQVNAGAAAARNRGVDEAAGRYVLLLDADDELMPEALETLRRRVLAQPMLGMVLGAQISVRANGRERLRTPPAVPAVDSRALIFRYLLQKRISISHGCSLFRRDLLLQRPYPTHLRSGEDIAVFAYLLISAPVAVISTPLARIYKHAGSLRHSRDKAEEYALGIVEEVFASLPVDCQSLRQRYTAQRYLSLFRASQSAGESGQARHYYVLALRLAPVQALRWSYLRKALRLLLGG